MNVEFAGGAFPGDARLTRAGVVARAPEWWRNLANTGLRSAAAAKSSAPSKPVRRPAHRGPVVVRERCAGWLVGAIAPGESSPAFSPQDGQTLPEVFAPSAWDAVIDQVRQGTKPIGLWLRHAGAMLACTSAGTLRLENHDIVGGMFQATLADDSLERLLMDEIGTGGVGVSVCYSNPVLAYDERDGRKVRVVRSAVVDHVALVRKGSGERALYSGARAFAVKADQRDQLSKAWSAARTAAWSVMRGNRRWTSAG